MEDGMPLKKLTLIVALVVMWAQPSRADWQYTKWGMTVEEAIAASKGSLQPCTKACDPIHLADGARLFGPYSSGDFHFTAYLLFHDGRLSSVRLVLQGGNYLTLAQAMRSKYGEPTVSNSVGDMWRTATEQVNLIALGHPTVMYQPRVNASNKGL
jgi:hypothetical protein